jgi:hypothetical protein
MLIYGLLAIAGAIGPWIYNLQFFGAGQEPLDFISILFTNPASASVTVDILIASLAFLIWMIIEAHRLGMKHWWIYIVVAIGVAFAAALPLFLLMRERKLQEFQNQSLI